MDSFFLKHNHSPLILAKEEEGSWPRASIYKFELGEKEAKRSSEGHQGSLSSSRSQGKESKGQRRALEEDRSSHVWQRQLLGGWNFRSAVGGWKSCNKRSKRCYWKRFHWVWIDRSWHIIQRGWSLSSRVLASVLRSWNLSIEESIRKRRDLRVFLSRGEVSAWLAAYILCHCSFVFGSCLMFHTYNKEQS